MPDIFEIRYGNFAAVLATITTVIAYTTIVSYQFSGKVLSMVSDGMISLEAGIIITAVFAISYTVLAGMFSVVYTDVVNGVLMTIGVLTALAVMIINIGGVGEMIQVLIRPVNGACLATGQLKGLVIFQGQSLQ